MYIHFLLENHDVGKIAKDSWLSFCLAVTFKVRHGFCSNSWFKKTRQHPKCLGNRCPPWPSPGVCSRDSIQRTPSPGPGGWELLCSSWDRSSFQLLSKGVTIRERAACSERAQQCDTACGGFLAVIARHCLVLEYLVPLLYLPHRAPSVLPGDPQATQLSPVPQSCTRLIGAVTSLAALCTVSLKKRKKTKKKKRWGGGHFPVPAVVNIPSTQQSCARVPHTLPVPAELSLRWGQLEGSERHVISL